MELKLEAQSSTLPRAGRSGKSQPPPAAANATSSTLLGSSNQQIDAAASEPPGISGKRRSAAHSYRMQTESSLAKVNAGKESSQESSNVRGSIGKKESYTMVRFPSTPNIAAEVREGDSGVESVKNSQKPGSVEDTDKRKSLWMDDHFKANSSSGVASSAKSHADDASQLTSANDFALMPPPLSTSVPLSYQATFIAKAAKHRRTTMPESLARSRELLAGALAKHHRLSDLSATDEDDSPPSSSSASRSTMSSKQSLDASPIEPPERDIHKTQSRVSSAQLTDISSRNTSNAECIKAEHSSDSVSSAGSSVTDSPKAVKIGRCVSPIRPQSASSTSYRRQLPPDPRVSITVTRGSESNAAACSAVTSCAFSQLSVTRSASAESGMRLSQSMQDTAVSQSASACHLSSESSADISKQMQKGPMPQQESGQRLIASKTETRLVLNPEHDNTEDSTCTAQQTIINEIEQFCTERRMSADRTREYEVSRSADRQEQRVADSGQLVVPVSYTRQQWEKSKPFEPFVIQSDSNSSVSQTPSSSVCNSSVLAYVSSLSRNNVSSVSSGSCLTYDMAAVTASVSDSVISYGSTAQMPTKFLSTAAVGVTDTNSSQQVPHNQSDVTKGEEADEDEQISEMRPATYTNSSGQPVSAMSSDKWVATTYHLIITIF